MTIESAGEPLTGIERGTQQRESSDATAQNRLVLASGSPRRLHLLRTAGYDFLIDPADIDESDHPTTLAPAELVVYLAERKAAAVALRHPTQVVLAADTVVAVGAVVLGKPAGASDAAAMLSRLSGTSHQVWTGVAVRAGSEARSLCVRSDVHMRTLSVDEIAAYVAGGQWRGKAGGYGIQDPDPFVTRIAGSETNIVGLPMDETRELLEAMGVASNPQPS